MMKVGYARVSSTDQNLARQLEHLQQAGAEKIFQEKVSGKDVEHRPELLKALDYVRQGDVLVVDSLDRLSRDYDDAGNLIRRLRGEGVKLDVLDAPFLSSKTGNADLDKMMSDLFVTILSYIAQNERKEIKARQRAGIELAKKRGAYKGKPRLYAPDSPDRKKRFIYQQVVKLLKEGTPIAQIARTAGLSRSQVYRIRDYSEV
nr:recombinase family protein [Lacticaseibacillus paracasei]